MSDGPGESAHRHGGRPPFVQLVERMALGSGAVSLAVVLGCLQVSPLDGALKVAVAAAAISLPLAVGATFVFEATLESWDARTGETTMHPRIGVVIFSLLSLGIFAAAVAVGAVLAHLAAFAVWLYVVTAVAVFLAITIGQTDYSAEVTRRRAEQRSRRGKR